MGGALSNATYFTPADIEYLFQKVRQVAFEKEYAQAGNCLVTMETFLEIIPEISPTLTEEIIGQFEMDCEKYIRY